MALVAAVAGLLGPAGAVAAASGPRASAGDPVAGSALFKQRCGVCHAVAPDLHGVLGRKAASAPTFTYSPALKASNLTWTPERLDQFLTGPQSMVPGTFMVITVPKPDERANVVAYLASLKR
jgi:cytochrome c